MKAGLLSFLYIPTQLTHDAESTLAPLRYRMAATAAADGFLLHIYARRPRTACGIPAALKNVGLR